MQITDNTKQMIFDLNRMEKLMTVTSRDEMQINISMFFSMVSGQHTKYGFAQQQILII